MTKQLKINKLFRKGVKTSEDCDEILEEIQQLQQSLKEKQDELFRFQREHYKGKHCNIATTKQKAEQFIRPQKITLLNSVESMKKGMEVISMLSGIEVQSYSAEDHCCVTFNMQHDSEHQVKHGLRVDLKSGLNEVSKFSLPLGFNINAVMEDFNNIMIPECLRAIRRALVAYYDRLEQYEALKKMLNLEAQLFKILDGSHVRISFVAINERDEDAEQLDVVLMLDYRVYDVRPKQCKFRETDFLDGVPEALTDQCLVFKQKPLQKAFKEAFMSGVGLYKLVEQVGAKPAPQPQRRHNRVGPQQRYGHNDDTFRPEDCPDESDDADIE